MSRHENLSVGNLVAETIVNPAGGSLLVSNTLATGSMFVGEANVATAKTMAQVMPLLFAGPGYYPVYAGVSDAEDDQNASIAITKTGVAATDFAIAVMVAGTTAQAVKKVVCTLNTVTVTLAGNGGVGTQVFYVVFRPTT